jgi:hypothetical protein
MSGRLPAAPGEGPVLPASPTRDRGRLSLVAATGQRVLGVGGDPDVGKE